MDLRITSSNGEKLVFDDVSLNRIKDYDTGKQFSKETICNLSITTPSSMLKTILYPNPAASFFYIQTSKKIKYQLFSSKGSLVRSGIATAAKDPILVDGLPRGLYYVSMGNTMRSLVLK